MAQSNVVSHESNLSDENKSSSKKLFTMEPRDVTSAIADYLGHGFNIYEANNSSSIMPSAIFNFQGKNCPSRTITYGGVDYTIPEIVDFLPDMRVSNESGATSQMSSLEEKFAASLDVSGSYGVFSAQLKTSYEESNTHTSESYYGYHFTTIGLGTFTLRRQEAQYFTDGFTADLAALPTTYSKDTFTEFQSFFNKYGIYFLSKFRAGGQLQMTNAVERTDSTSESTASADLSAQYDGLFVSGSFSASVTKSQAWEEFSKSSKTNLQGYGGSTKAISDLVAIDPMNPSEASLAAYQEWADSIGTAAVPTNYTLTPISQVCGDKESAVAAAMKAYACQINITTNFDKDYGSGTPKYKLYGKLSINGKKATLPSSAKSPSDEAGIQVVIIDRKEPDTFIVNNFFTYDPDRWQETYPVMYEGLYETLKDYTEPKYLVILRSSNLQKGCFPLGKFYDYITETLNVDPTDLLAWKNSIYTTFAPGPTEFYLVSPCGVVTTDPDDTAVLAYAYWGNSTQDISRGTYQPNITIAAVSKSDTQIDLIPSFYRDPY
jgi:hypothetical protein